MTCRPRQAIGNSNDTGEDGKADQKMYSGLDDLKMRCRVVNVVGLRRLAAAIFQLVPPYSSATPMIPALFG
jgi:hypothetical protein